MPEAEPVTDAIAEHAEGPCWSPEWGGLAFVDMLAGDVVRRSADGLLERWHVGTIAAVVRPRARGGLVVATEHGVVTADRFGGPTTPLVAVIDDPAVRCNEGGCDPAGNFLIGTMAYDQTPGAASLYRVTPAGDLTVVIPAVTVSNGLSWTAAGDLAYYADSATGRVDVFDSAPDGQLTGRRPFVVIEDGQGSPDGLTVDAAGTVWVALYGGSAVRAFTPDGRLVEQIDLPVPKVTACTFGGAALDELYITTSRENDGADAPPLAGAVFMVKPGGTGLPVLPFAG